MIQDELGFPHPKSYPMLLKRQDTRTPLDIGALCATLRRPSARRTWESGSLAVYLVLREMRGSPGRLYVVS